MANVCSWPKAEADPRRTFGFLYIGAFGKDTMPYDILLDAQLGKRIWNR